MAAAVSVSAGGSSAAAAAWRQQRGDSAAAGGGSSTHTSFSHPSPPLAIPTSSPPLAPLRSDELVLVHVQDETMAPDEIEWRLAIVRKVERARAGRFQVCVQRRDATYDEAFLEWYWKDNEGEDWRRFEAGDDPSDEIAIAAEAAAAVAETEAEVGPLRLPSAASVASTATAAAALGAAGYPLAPSAAAATPAAAASSFAANTSARPSFPAPTSTAVASLGYPEGMDGIRALLTECRLLAYAPAFEESGYDDAEFVLRLAQRNGSELADLYEHVGFKPGHAARFGHELKQRACQRVD